MRRSRFTPFLMSLLVLGCGEEPPTALDGLSIVSNPDAPVRLTTIHKRRAPVRFGAPLAEIWAFRPERVMRVSRFALMPVLLFTACTDEPGSRPLIGTRTRPHPSGGRTNAANWCGWAGLGTTVIDMETTT